MRIYQDIIYIMNEMEKVFDKVHNNARKETAKAFAK